MEFPDVFVDKPGDANAGEHMIVTFPGQVNRTPLASAHSSPGGDATGG